MAARLPSSVGQQNIPVYKLLVSSDKKHFFVNLIPVARCPVPTALKETEQILTNRRSQTGKRDAVPRVYLHLFGGGR